MGELIGVATTEKDGLLSKTNAKALCFRLDNAGATTNKIFELKNFSNELNHIIVLGRTNTNNLAVIQLVFSSRFHMLMSKSGSAAKMYYKTEDGGSRRYFLSPSSSYGFLLCRLLVTWNTAVEYEDVSGTVDVSELTEII